MIRFIYPILLLSLSVQALQILQPVDTHKTTPQHGDNKQNVQHSMDKALVNLKKSAKSGDAHAQFNLANIYHNGIGVEVNQKLAFYWYFQVAKQGYANAQLNVANSYYHGKGVAKNLKKAIYWYEKSAKQGNLSAHYDLALLRLNGNGVEQDTKKALLTLLDLSDKGYALAHYQLFLIYQRGVITNKDSELAKFYLRRISQPKHAKIQYQLGKDFYDQGMNEDAYFWIKLAAENNHLPAAELLEKLDKSKQQQAAELAKIEEEKAIEAQKRVAAEKAAELKKIQKLAELIKTKKLTKIPKPLPQSISNFPLITQNTLNNPLLTKNSVNFIPSHSQIAESLNNNSKTLNSLENLVLVAKQGDPIAQHNLSLLYSAGEIVRKDNRAAFILMNKAANQGLTQSQNALAVMYIKGTGVESDHKKAYYWATITAQKGDKRGKQILLYLINNF